MPPKYGGTGFRWHVKGFPDPPVPQGDLTSYNIFQLLVPIF